MPLWIACGRTLGPISVGGVPRGRTIPFSSAFHRPGVSAGRRERSYSPLKTSQRPLSRRVTFPPCTPTLAGHRYRESPNKSGPTPGLRCGSTISRKGWTIRGGVATPSESQLSQRSVAALAGVKRQREKCARRNEDENRRHFEALVPGGGWIERLLSPSDPRRVSRAGISIGSIF